MKNKFTLLEFFAGGGMARLGLGDSWECLFANDIDPQKCASYRANFRANIDERDIAALVVDDLPQLQADLAWGSFPCQDLSLAGRRGGIKAHRSGTFFEYWRLINALDDRGFAPKLVVLENVVGLLSSNGGRDFQIICEQLMTSGYLVSALIIDAKTFTPQSRPRLFIVGIHSTIARENNDVASIETAPPSLQAAYNQFSTKLKSNWIWLDQVPAKMRTTQLADIIDWEAPHWNSAAQTDNLLSMMSDPQRKRLDGIVRNRARRVGTAFRRTRIENGNPVQRLEARFDGIAGCLRTPAGGSSRQIVIAIEHGNVRTRLLAPRESARLMGIPDDYLLPNSVSAALKLCGDGVCVPAVRWLSEMIIAPTLASHQTNWFANQRDKTRLIA